MVDDNVVDDRLVAALELFNAEEFFACHDLLEEIWSETLDGQRNLYQGLIHAAVALFHFSEGNLGGARKMYDSTMRYLTPYKEEWRGLNLLRFREQFTACFQSLLEVQGGYPHGLLIDPERIPKLYFKSDNEAPDACIT